MSAQPVVRLFRCRPVRYEFDSILRERMIPDLLRSPGVLDVHVGRHGPDSIGERLVASIWATEAAMVSAMGTDIEASLFHPEYLEETTDRRLQVHPLAISAVAGRQEPARVLRLVEGRVRAGELDAYVDEARRGTEQDIATGRGPLALYLAGLPPDRFVTLSVWTDWPAIEAATGAGTDRPGATRHAERLAETRVEHYEVVPR